MSPAGLSRSCWKKKYVQVEPAVITPASETAIRMRLLAGVTLKFITVTIHRPERRSNRTRGYAVDCPLRTESKNVSVATLRTPSAAPDDLRNVRMRPFRATRNCVGPAAPIVSGGKAFVSAEVAPRKLTPSVCGAEGPGGATAAAPSMLAVSAGESAFEGRSARGETSLGAARRGAGIPSAAVWAASISATERR